MQTRTRDDVLADIADYRHQAGRMTIASVDYPTCHAIINDLLDELGTIDRPADAHDAPRAHAASE